MINQPLYTILKVLYLFCKGLRSGCTAVVALISGNKLYIGWLGDSQAVLSKDKKAVSLMEPHKPENQVSLG